MSIAKTPAPPYYSVTTTVVFNPDTEGYISQALELIEIAQDTEGFLGIESCLQPDSGIAISYWRSLEDIQRWKDHSLHMKAKALGRTKWFKQYFTRIALVERGY
ncbi:hypothetical protein U062_00625 [Gammaproteobacteria bacterium MOLA455]|nr:hypothetical protein U062_00625 [Gammaproteobacteria bacterium MOLA455]